MHDGWSSTAAAQRHQDQKLVQTAQQAQALAEAETNKARIAATQDTRPHGTDGSELEELQGKLRSVEMALVAEKLQRQQMVESHQCEAATTYAKLQEQTSALEAAATTAEILAVIRKTDEFSPLQASLNEAEARNQATKDAAEADVLAVQSQLRESLAAAEIRALELQSTLSTCEERERESAAQLRVMTSDSAAAVALLQQQLTESAAATATEAARCSELEQSLASFVCRAEVSVRDSRSKSESANASTESALKEPQLVKLSMVDTSVGPDEYMVDQLTTLKQQLTEQHAGAEKASWLLQKQLTAVAKELESVRTERDDANAMVARASSTGSDSWHLSHAKAKTAQVQADAAQELAAAHRDAQANIRALEEQSAEQLQALADSMRSAVLELSTALEEERMKRRDLADQLAVAGLMHKRTEKMLRETAKGGARPLSQAVEMPGVGRVDDTDSITGDSDVRLGQTSSAQRLGAKQWLSQALAAPVGGTDAIRSLLLAPARSTPSEARRTAEAVVEAAEALRLEQETLAQLRAAELQRRTSEAAVVEAQMNAARLLQARQRGKWVRVLAGAEREAAILMQRWARGYVVRKEQSRQVSAVRIQSAERGRSARAAGRRFYAAATALQAGQRGKHGRHRAAMLRRQQVEAVEAQVTREVAVMALQARQRGNSTRHRLKKELEVAAAIQRDVQQAQKARHVLEKEAARQKARARKDQVAQTMKQAGASSSPRLGDPYGGGAVGLLAGMRSSSAVSAGRAFGTPLRLSSLSGHGGPPAPRVLTPAKVSQLLATFATSGGSTARARAASGDPHRRGAELSQAGSLVEANRLEFERAKVEVEAAEAALARAEARSSARTSLVGSAGTGTGGTRRVDWSAIATTTAKPRMATRSFEEDMLVAASTMVTEPSSSSSAVRVGLPVESPGGLAFAELMESSKEVKPGKDLWDHRHVAM